MADSLAGRLPAETTRLLYDVDGLATALSVSAKTIRRMAAAGRLPRAVRVGVGGRSLRWRRTEIVSWTEAGCPPLDEWEPD